MRISFLTRSLEYGGAERQLVTLALGMRELGHEVTVTLFYPVGPLIGLLEERGITVLSLDKRGRWDILPFFIRLVKSVRQKKIDILHSYLAVPNILAILLRPFLYGVKIVWGVRASNMDFDRYDRLSRFAGWVEGKLACFADMIIVNSNAGVKHSASIGYPKDRMVMIPNGIDTKCFFPSHEAGKRFRKEFKITDTEKVIGIVARLDPMKGYPTFLKAGALMIKEMTDIRLVCVGAGSNSYLAEMKRLSETLGISGRVLWAGACDDMNAVYNAFDIGTISSSFGEGFPNAIGEAMACGVACAVTDVGDSSFIVGKTGISVLPDDPEALAIAWKSLLQKVDNDKERPGNETRDRIENMFSRKILIEKTTEQLRRLL